MAFENWDDVGGALALALDYLPDGEFLILGEPVTEPEPPRGIFRRRRSRRAATRYVQAIRLEDHLSAECVGPTTMGGAWEMNEATILQLRGLGWNTPEDYRREYGSDTPNFQLYVERGGSAVLTLMLIGSLQVLGAVPEELEFQTSA